MVSLAWVARSTPKVYASWWKPQPQVTQPQVTQPQKQDAVPTTYTKETEEDKTMRIHLKRLRVTLDKNNRFQVRKERKWQDALQYYETHATPATGATVKLEVALILAVSNCCHHLQRFVRDNFGDVHDIPMEVHVLLVQAKESANYFAECEQYYAMVRHAWKVAGRRPDASLMVAMSHIYLRRGHMDAAVALLKTYDTEAKETKPYVSPRDKKLVALLRIRLVETPEEAARLFPADPDGQYLRAMLAACERLKDVDTARSLLKKHQNIASEGDRLKCLLMSACNPPQFIEEMQRQFANGSLSVHERLMALESCAKCGPEAIGLAEALFTNLLETEQAALPQCWEMLAQVYVNEKRHDTLHALLAEMKRRSMPQRGRMHHILRGQLSR